MIILAAEMDNLNLPDYNHKVRDDNGRKEIFDRIRKKFVALTPEEWVRQNFIAFLIEEKGWPPSLIAVEKGLKVNNMAKRTDIVLYDSSARPRMIVECKAPSAEITQQTFDQAARYNLSLKVEFLTITNGLNHYCCRVDAKNNSISFLKDIPGYQQINNSDG